MLNASAKARNEVLADWNKRGGRDVAIEGLSNAFQALLNIITPIKNAFRDIFPAMTGKTLFNLTKMFRDFTEGLIASKGTMENIRSIFRALFAVVGVGVDIVQGLIQYFVIDFIKLLSGGTGGLLDFVGSIADVVTSLALWLREGDKIGKFFDFFSGTRAALLGPIIKGFGELLSVLGGFVSTGAEVVINAITAGFKALQPILELVWTGLQIAADVVQGSLLSAFGALPPILENVREGLKTAADVVRSSLVAAFEALKPVLDVVKSSLSTAFDALPSILANVKSAIADAFGSLSGVGGALGGALGGLASIFDISSTTDAAKNGINNVQYACKSAESSTKRTTNTRKGTESIGNCRLNIG